MVTRYRSRVGDQALQQPRVLRRLTTVAVLVVVLWPAVAGRDSFPVSSYPMYAFERARTDRFETVVGESSAGDLVPLSIRVIANTDDPLIAEALVANSIRTGTSDQLCAQVAQRVGPGIARVLVVEEVHDVVQRAQDSSSVQERVVRATCEVPR